MDDSKSGFLGCLGAILILAYGVAQIIAGYQGIYHHLGGFWSAVALFATFILRFSLPITLGAFFGAKDVWNWHWFWALLFAAPTLVLLGPGVLISIVEWVTSKWKKHS